MLALNPCFSLGTVAAAIDLPSYFIAVVWTQFCFLTLQEQRHLTHENVQRKQARTGEEREEEEEEQISESESEDEENEIIYNPKNLPLGWDGKVAEAVRSGFSSEPVGDPTSLFCLKLPCHLA